MFQDLSRRSIETVFFENLRRDSNSLNSDSELSFYIFLHWKRIHRKKSIKEKKLIFILNQSNRDRKSQLVGSRTELLNLSTEGVYLDILWPVYDSNSCQIWWNKALFVADVMVLQTISVPGGRWNNYNCVISNCDLVWLIFVITCFDFNELEFQRASKALDPCLEQERETSSPASFLANPSLKIETFNQQNKNKHWMGKSFSQLWFQRSSLG